jgi:hypothetical protein
VNAFQIRDGTFGLAIYHAETGEEALADFLADQKRREVRDAPKTRNEDGSVSVEVDGEVFSAVPSNIRP